MINGYSSYEIQLPDGLANLWELSGEETDNFNLTAKQTEELDLLLKTDKPIYLLFKGVETITIIKPIIDIDISGESKAYILKGTSSMVEDDSTIIYTLLVVKDLSQTYNIRVHAYAL